ncbi:hypothetical protein V2J09_019347 [Rumex salicifolius]
MSKPASTTFLWYVEVSKPGGDGEEHCLWRNPERGVLLIVNGFKRLNTKNSNLLLLESPESRSTISSVNKKFASQSSDLPYPSQLAFVQNGSKLPLGSLPN